MFSHTYIVRAGEVHSFFKHIKLGKFIKILVKFKVKIIFIFSVFKSYELNRKTK